MRLRATLLVIAFTVAALSAGVGARAVEQAPQNETDAKAQAEAPAPQTPAEMRAELYARLASKDSDETEGLVGLLLAAYSQSGSDTGDLLLSRAHKAMEA